VPAATLCRVATTLTPPRVVPAARARWWLTARAGGLLTAVRPVGGPWRVSPAVVLAFVTSAAACTAGLWWFLGDTSTALLTWRTD
jgi:hypothetical protein